MKVTDCPYRPGTPEHNAWVRDALIPWQYNDPETVATANRNHEAAEQMWRDMEQANPARVAADAVMREVEEAIRPRPNMTGLWPYISTDATAFRAAIAAMQKQMLAVGQAFATVSATVWSVPIVSFGSVPSLRAGETAPSTTAWPPVPSRRTTLTGGGPARRRMPAKPQGRCHHGNPRNARRDCSMGRR